MRATIFWSGVAALCRMGFRGVALSVILAMPALAATSSPDEGIAITVAPGNWGSADLQDIQTVLRSVATEFSSHVAPESRLKIRVAPRGKAPRVLYERGPDGEYVVHLTARNENWFQYAYQFSHELCHILSNFDHKEGAEAEVATGNQWFEESLCETASLFTLKRLAQTWESAPPQRKWVGYAPLFAKYADHLLAADHRHLPATRNLANWYEENRASLRQSPYQREKNELVATALLGFFEADASRWHAVAYLNRDRASAAKSFPDYLADWQAACPLPLREVARWTSALFGLAPAGDYVARLGAGADQSLQ